MRAGMLVVAMAASSLFVALLACATQHGEEIAMQADRRPPNIAALTSAPLRNRMRIELEAPVSEVWALLGNLARFPEYSTGLERVDAKVDSSGRCIEYVCHFKPREQGAPGISERNLMRWYEPNRGYASSAEEGNAFGLTNDLNLVTVEPSEDGAILMWEEYYDALDLEMNRAEFDRALADLGENLVRRFGGRILERYVEGQPGRHRP